MRVETDDDRRLHAYVDGQLDAAGRAAVAARLATDPAARGTAEAYAAERGLLREAWDGVDDPPEDPRTAALTDELARRLEARRAGPARPPARRLRAALVPAALVAAAALGWFVNDASSPAPVTATTPVAAAPANLPSAVQIPSLTELGMRFVGGNVTDTPEGVLAYLTYHDTSGARVSLAISPYPHDGSTRPVVTEREGVRQAHWSGARRSYVATTTARGVALEAIAASLDPPRVGRAP